MMFTDKPESHQALLSLNKKVIGPGIGKVLLVTYSSVRITLTKTIYHHMKSLADTSGLMEKTTSMLMGSEESFTARAGVDLIDQWITPLSESENTQQVARELQKLKALISASPANSSEVYAQMGVLAAQVLLIAPDIGAEGEMPSLLAALAAALRIGTGVKS